MTFTESESYPSFEDFMSEDKLPPVFPSSQSSNVSETQVYSQHLISEVCDLETYGPFGIKTKDDDLPFSFINSSLAYSPKSIPPHSPSADGSSPFNETPASSPIFDPLDIANNDEADDILGELAEPLNDPSSSHDDEIIMDASISGPFLEDDVFNHLLSTDFSDLSQDFPKTQNLPSPSITTTITPPSPCTTPAPVIETPTVSTIKTDCISFESTSSISTSSSIITSTSTSTCTSTINQSTTSDESIASKKPSNRGRKRKLFTNCEEKKRDQNKEAARRYREKKKNEDSLLEAEEAELLIKRKEFKKEVEFLERTFSEVLELYKTTFRTGRRKY